MSNCLVLFFSLCLSLALGDTLKFSSTYNTYQKPMFSTKTAYDWLTPEASVYFGTAPGLRSTVQYGERNCSAIYVNTVLRHGARYPGGDDIATLFNIQSLLDMLDFSDERNPFTRYLHKWRSPFSDHDKGLLLGLGAREHFATGFDFARSFGDLFMQGGALLPLHFVSSSMQRCRDSLQSFERGVKSYLQKRSGMNGSNYSYDEREFENVTQHSVNDTLMRFFDKCTKYKRLLKNETASTEYHKFYNGDLMANVVNNVHKKFGINGTYFKTEDVRVMYATCAFEQCLANISHWCRLFDQDDFNVLEYLGDLKHYWMRSYGNRINYEQSCPLVKNIFEDLQNSINAHIAGKRFTVAKFMFGHAETLAPLYSILGLFKDTDVLRADNYRQLFGRKFRTSFILPFAANMAVVAYHCSPQRTSDAAEDQRTSDAAEDQRASEAVGNRTSSDAVENRQRSEAAENQQRSEAAENQQRAEAADDGKSGGGGGGGDKQRLRQGDYVLQVYVNKHLVALPGCGVICPLDKFMLRYKSIRNCSYEEICLMNTSKVEL